MIPSRGAPRPVAPSASSPDAGENTVAGILASAALAAGGASLGGVAIAVSSRGAGDRPVLAVGVLLLGGAAAVAPLRFGLPLAIVLACFGGFFRDFAGGVAPYWSEVFVAGLVLKAIWRRPPTRADVVIWLPFVLLFGCYLATGSSLRSVAWAMKVLLLSLAAAWALARLVDRRSTWKATLQGFAIASSAALVLGLWQRAKGLSALHELGINSASLKAGSHGTVRAFAGFTSPAPFSYAAAITILVWLAFLFGSRRDGFLALSLAWVPVAAAGAMLLAADRTAIAALTVGVAVAALGAPVGRAVRLVIAAGGILLLAVVIMAQASTRNFFADAFHFRSGAGGSRVALWRDYLTDFSAFGAGPATAGAAYQKVAPKGLQVVFECAGCLSAYGWTGQRYRWIGDEATISIRMSSGRRPPLVFSGEARPGAARPIRLTIEVKDVVAERLNLRAGRDTPFRVRIPSGSGAAGVLVTFRASPRGSSADARRTVRLGSLELTGWPPPASPAERVRERRLFSGPATGVVDNLYVSWVFQYGLAGIVLSMIWLAVLLWPFRRPPPDATLALAARAVGVFLIVGALTVNIWEEAPTDLLAALVFAHAWAARSAATRGRRSGARPRPPRAET